MVLRQLRKPSDDPWSLNTGTHKSEQGNRSIVFSKKNCFFNLLAITVWCSYEPDVCLWPRAAVSMWRSEDNSRGVSFLLPLRGASGVLQVCRLTR